MPDAVPSVRFPTIGDDVEDDRYVGSTDVTHWYTPFGRFLARLASVASARIGANPTLALILVVGGAIAFALSFLASRIYDAVTESDGVAGLDAPIQAFAIQLRSPVPDTIAAGIAFVFGPIGMPVMALIAIAVLSIARRSRTPLILIAACGIGSLLMTLAGKDIIGRHRPPLADALPPFEYSPSFPSGHTLNAVAITGVVIYLVVLRRRTLAARTTLIVAGVLVALVVGCSRILLGAHWFTDVLAGWTLGAAWLALVITAHRLFLTARVRVRTESAVTSQNRGSGDDRPYGP
jgi:membrane-associated phospholipid phosphatase